jgi:hypothetical protein
MRTSGRFRGFLHRLRWPRRREPEPAPDAALPDTGDTVARVHAVLVPDGLIEVDGVVEAAVWTGPGVAPGRGSPVSVRYDRAGGLWTASAAGREDTLP